LSQGELNELNHIFRKTYCFNPFVLRCTVLVITWMFWLTNVEAAELIIRIENPQGNGKVIAMLFNSSSTFVDLRDPLTLVTLPSGGTAPERIPDLASGEYALVIFQDENGNGRLDKNFIGIPSEPLGFSNRYWPQGPPAFTRAAFKLEAEESRTIEVKLQSVFGKLGRLGLGVGVIAQTSPYRKVKNRNVRPIPAISYIGDRVQILGLKALCGIVDVGYFSLAATTSYQFGAYREKDSPYLHGMGNRAGTIGGGAGITV
jgi:outer membrane protein